MKCSLHHGLLVLFKLPGGVTGKVSVAEDAGEFVGAGELKSLFQIL